MNILLKMIRNILAEKVQDIDSGNCDMSEEECTKVLKNLEVLGRKDIPMSKYQAYTHLGMSRATFDNYIREGKLPRGKKVAGFKELMWTQRDLDKAVRECQRKR